MLSLDGASAQCMMPRRFQQVAQDIAPSKNWAFRKFYIMRLFEQAIPRFGSANWCSTAFGERSHKDMKSQAAFTNGREEQMDLQVTPVFPQIAACMSCCKACVTPHFFHADVAT